MRITEHFFDESLLRELEAIYAVPDLLSWLNEEAERLSLLGSTAKGMVRVASTRLLRERRVTELVEAQLAGQLACLIPGSDGYTIKYQGRLPVDRRRFSIAHELGHTYWFSSVRLGKPLTRYQSSGAGALTIERLCDYFAGALLLPLQTLSRIVSPYKSDSVPPLHLIPKLAKDFWVADKAVARRLFCDLMPQRITVVKLYTAIDDKGIPTPDNWRVSWATVPADVRAAETIDGLSVPFRSRGRAIPSEMVPTLTGPGPEKILVDGRWAEAVEPQGARRARIAFRRRGPRKPIAACAYQFNEHVDVSFFRQGRVRRAMYICFLRDVELE